MNKQKLLNELREDGFSSEIIDAFHKIKREDFIPEGVKHFAYENEPLPIGNGATISQPYTIAFMLNLLELDKLNNKKPKILEVGSGSGYVLALINELLPDSKIYGIERIKELVDKSKKILKNNKNIKIFQGDGSRGFEKEKLFDRILVSAAANEIPPSLISQLNENGILVIPVRNSIFQIGKIDGKTVKKEYSGFVFVPLIDGEERGVRPRDICPRATEN